MPVQMMRTFIMLTQLIMTALSLASKYKQLDSQGVEQAMSAVTQDVLRETIAPGSVDLTLIPNKLTDPLPGIRTEAVLMTETVASTPPREMSDMVLKGISDSHLSTHLQEYSSDGLSLTGESIPTEQTYRTTKYSHSTLLSKHDRRSTHRMGLRLRGSLYYKDADPRHTADYDEGQEGESTLASENEDSSSNVIYNMPYVDTQNAPDTEIFKASNEGEEMEESIASETTDIEGAKDDRSLLKGTVSTIKSTASTDPDNDSHTQNLFTKGGQVIQESALTTDNKADSRTRSSLLYSKEPTLRLQTYTEQFTSGAHVISQKTNKGADITINATSMKHVEQKLNKLSTVENENQTESPVRLHTRGNFPTQGLDTTSVVPTFGYDEDREGEFTSVNEDHGSADDQNYRKPNFETKTAEPIDMETEKTTVSDISSQAIDCSTPYDRISPSESKVSTSAFNVASISSLLANSSEVEHGKLPTFGELQQISTENATKGIENTDSQRPTSALSMQPVIQNAESSTAISEPVQEPSITPESADILETENGASFSQNTPKDIVSIDVVDSKAVHSNKHTQIPGTMTMQDVQSSSMTNDYVPSMKNSSTGQFGAYSVSNARVLQTDPERLSSQPSEVSRRTDQIRETDSYSSHTDMVEQKYNQLHTLQADTSVASLKSRNSTTRLYAIDDSSDENNEVSTIQTHASGMSRETNQTTLAPSSTENESVSTITSALLEDYGLPSEEAVASGELLDYNTERNTFAAANGGSSFEGRYHAGSGDITTIIPVSETTTEPVSADVSSDLIETEPRTTDSDSTNNVSKTENMLTENTKSPPPPPNRKDTIEFTPSFEHFPTNGDSTDDHASRKLADTTTKALRPIVGATFNGNWLKTVVEISEQISEPPTNGSGSREINMTSRRTDLYTHGPLDFTSRHQQQPTGDNGDAASEAHDTPAKTEGHPSDVYEVNGARNKPNTFSDNTPWTVFNETPIMSSKEATSNRTENATSTSVELRIIGIKLSNLLGRPRSSSTKILAGPFVAVFVICQLIPNCDFQSIFN